ncbi:MAG: MerR family transcriptional regulator [Gammaproteobacteria bacterium]
MKLKIGELASRTGITVRTLHHYDDIGLLRPSARSDAGYRLYDDNDLQRLQQVQVLRRFGMPLADIGTFLASPDARLLDIVERQLEVLDRQIDEAAQLRSQLLRLRTQITQGDAPDLAVWRTTLEHMTMFDKYFTQDELRQLPFAQQDPASTRQWQSLVARAQQMIDAGVAPASDEARQLAREWMIALERDSGGNPEFAMRVTHMHDQEPALRKQKGLTHALQAFVMEAFTQFRLGLFQPYLSAEEFAFMNAHYRDRGTEWPGLIARVRAAHLEAKPPGHPDTQALMRQWMDLTRSYAGDDPATHKKVRTAIESEPDLLIGSWITDELRAYLGAAMAVARAGSGPATAPAR